MSLKPCRLKPWNHEGWNRHQLHDFVVSYFSFVISCSWFHDFVISISWFRVFASWFHVYDFVISWFRDSWFHDFAFWFRGFMFCLKFLIFGDMSFTRRELRAVCFRVFRFRDFMISYSLFRGFVVSRFVDFVVSWFCFMISFHDFMISCSWFRGFVVSKFRHFVVSWFRGSWFLPNRACR